MEGTLLDFRVGSLALSVLIFVMVSASLLLARRLNGTTPLGVKLGLFALWLFAILRLYSASSYLWGKWAVDAGIFPLLRASVFVMLTVILIIVLALFTFYWRRLRNREH